MTDKPLPDLKPKRKPNPFPGLKRSEMTIVQRIEFERWIGLTPDTSERLKRQRIINKDQT